jgi:autotransporter-associated beta strand protein
MKTKTKPPLTPAPALWLAIITILFSLCVSARAQVTANWQTANGEWNTVANWDQGIVPGPGTNASIGSGYIVTYDTPMAAPSIGTLALGGSLAINTTGFNIDSLTNGGPAFTLNTSSASLTIGPGGVATFANGTNNSTFIMGASLTNNGTLILTNCGTIIVPNVTAGNTNELSFNAGSVFIMTNSFASAGLNVGADSKSSQGGAIVTINGTVTLDKMLTIAGTNSMVLVSGGTLNCLANTRINETGNDNRPRVVVTGGVANLGNFSVYRSTSSGGLLETNGVVNVTGFQLGVGNAASFSTIAGGVLTNTGTFTINDTTNLATSDRRAQFLVRGGAVYSTGPNGIIIANQSQTNPSVTIAGSGAGGVLDISSGSVTAEKLTLIRDNTITNNYAGLKLSGSGILYLGSGGLIGNVGAAKTFFTNAFSGGTLAAKADWSSSAPIGLIGNTTFQAADASGIAHNMTLSGRINLAGALIKTGGGILTLAATNTYSGGTFVNQGTLALGATGMVSGAIMVAAGATFDASAVSGGFQLAASQPLGGSGTIVGPVTALSGSSIRPASNTITGTITFNNTLTESGGVVNNFDISTDPNGVNDLVTVNGDLVLLGINTIQVNPLGLLTIGDTYPLFQYTGNLTGDTNNLTVAGANAHTLVNTTTKTVLLVVDKPGPVPSDVLWRGGITGNAWDTLISSNWFYTATGTRDLFVVGDRATFDDTGATNPLVTISGSVSPASLVVNSTSNYIFTGTGSIDGIAGLTKTNSGTLTILTTNSYSGATIVGGGTLEVGNLASSGVPSSLGAPGADSANLVLIDSTLRYLGGGVTTDRGATLNDLGATIDVTNSSTTLTVNGPVVGTGGVTKVGPGTLTLGAGVNSYAGATTVSNGTLRVNAATGLGTNTVVLAGGTLFPSLGSTSTGIPNNFIVSAPSTYNVGGGNQYMNGVWSGAGTLNLIVSTNGYFTFNADFSGFTGTISLGTNDGNFRFNAGGGNPCTGNSNALIDLGTGFAVLFNRNGGGISYDLGGLAGGPNTQVRGAANVNTANTYVIGNKGLNTTFAGVITNGTAGSVSVVSIFKIGAGTLTLSGANSYTGPTIISNGAIALSGAGALAKSANIDILTNAVLNSSGRIDGTLTVNTNQTLTGEGTVLGSVTVANGGILSPGENEGAAPWGSGFLGVLTITNSLVLQAGSTTVMDIDQADNLYDQVKGLASVTYGGVLDVSRLSSSYNVGDKFKLFSAHSYGGSFANILPALPNGGSEVGWDLSYLTIDGTLRVGALRPWIGSYQVSGGAITITGLAGQPNSPYNLLSSTNVALPVSQWTTNQTGVMNNDGTFSVTATVDPNKPQEFFRIQMQIVQ